jgi:hypothetical protein
MSHYLDFLVSTIMDVINYFSVLTLFIHMMQPFYWNTKRTCCLWNTTDTKIFHPINWHGYAPATYSTINLTKTFEVMWLKISVKNRTRIFLALYNMIAYNTLQSTLRYNNFSKSETDNQTDLEACHVLLLYYWKWLDGNPWYQYNKLEL